MKRPINIIHLEVSAGPLERPVNEAQTFWGEQTIGTRKEGEAGHLSQLCCKHSVSDASIYKSEAKYAGMDVFDAKRLKTLEDASVNQGLWGM